jgi:hypothetical protein
MKGGGQVKYDHNQATKVKILIKFYAEVSFNKKLIKIFTTKCNFLTLFCDALNGGLLGIEICCMQLTTVDGKESRRAPAISKF